MQRAFIQKHEEDITPLREKGTAHMSRQVAQKVIQMVNWYPGGHSALLVIKNTKHLYAALKSMFFSMELRKNWTTYSLLVQFKLINDPFT